MHITSVAAKSFKGGTFNQPLTPVTVIAGPNARGKSSRIEAATLTLCGFLPGLPKTANGIFTALASGNPMRTEVGLLPDGSLCPDVIWREWRETKGKVVFTGPEKAIMPAVAMDAAEFFALSGPDRVKYIFARCQVDLSVEKLALSIKANIKNIKLEENTPATEAVINNICLNIIESFADSSPFNASPQQYIAAVHEQCREALKLANENSKRMASTVQGLTQIKEDTGASGDIEQRLAAARAALDAANSEVARLKQVGMQMAADLAEAERLQLSQVDETAVNAKINEARANIALLGIVPGAGEKPVAKQMPSQRPTDSVERTALNSANQNVLEANSDLYAATTDMKKLEQDIESASKQTECPTCGHDISEKQKSIVKELRAKLKAATGLHVSKSAVQAVAIGNLANAEEALKQVQASISKWDADKSKLDEEYQTKCSTWNNATDNYNQAQRKINEATAEIARLESRIAGNSAAREANAKLPELRQRIEQARTEYQAAGTVVNNRLLDVNNLDIEYKALLKQRAEASSRATALEEAAKHKAEATVLKEVVALLQALQEEIITKSVKPILDKANELCSGILRLPLALVDGEVGMQGPTGFVGHRTASDSERIMIYAALSLALASEAPFKLCIIGRFESFDEDKQAQLIVRALDLIRAGKLDQCLFVLVGKAKYGHHNFSTDENFSVVTL